MLLAITWLDHAVIVAYLIAMIAFGVYLSRRRKTDDEYFLAGRNMPWFAVGVSIIASLLSSLTYLSEPGEVWKSGVTHVAGKLLAIPLEMVVVWLFCIPFMMSFRYTSAYEYLGDRFGTAARKTGVGLFIVMVLLWMGFVVLVSAQALAQVSGMSLPVVIGTIGIVATLYTMLGGLRAVIWTDVIQVAILTGGGLFVVGYIAAETGTWLPDWYAAATDYVQSSAEYEATPLFSLDPTVRATVVTVALNMTVWHVCTHLGNQMTVQRYFSTSNARTARRSFLTGALIGFGLNVLLVVVGLAVLYFYVGQDIPVDRALDPVTRDRDLIFPTFAVNRLPPGVGGAILAALLAAAMSTIDSGVNSLATVLTVELRTAEQRAHAAPHEHVALAMNITLAAGVFITFAAYGLSFLPTGWGIVDAMPRTFNAVTGPLGGLFLVGMFLPRAGQREALAATACGLATSIGLGYFEQIQDLALAAGLLKQAAPAVSFTWIMPSALAVTFVSAWIFSRRNQESARDLSGLTWYTRRASAADAPPVNDPASTNP